MSRFEVRFNMNIALQELVMKNRRIRFDEVRSQGKLLVSLLRGWRMIGCDSNALG
jgi:hypothetical protein